MIEELLCRIEILNRRKEQLSKLVEESVDRVISIQLKAFQQEGYDFNNPVLKSEINRIIQQYKQDTAGSIIEELNKIEQQLVFCKELLLEYGGSYDSTRI